MVKFLQLNLNHCRAAQDLLSQTAIEQRIDIAILSEPYKAKPEGVWQQSADGGAAIWSCGQPPEHLSQRASIPGYARAKCQATTIYSCYLPPSMHIDAFKDVIQEIAQDARGRSPVFGPGPYAPRCPITTCAASSPSQSPPTTSRGYHAAVAPRQVDGPSASQLFDLTTDEDSADERPAVAVRSRPPGTSTRGPPRGGARQQLRGEPPY
ncbi:uncharacterized protein [Drosophila kikkawai]|uniref:Endonuclease/exonuclease/phosphatase domain-containing protein n=1 Tax=Drosophila kikkawai TaxID=30033 RepID=A0ABM3C761_DROKI|nr:uncharacterized protein LOC121502768 [Drosophila kikkawai]